jgi:hypothetical protein
MVFTERGIPSNFWGEVWVVASQSAFLVSYALLAMSPAVSFCSLSAIMLYKQMEIPFYYFGSLM